MMPDVVAFPLPLAKEVLAAAGFSIKDIVTILPPREQQATGELRVVRQRLVGQHAVALIVCHQLETVSLN